MELNKTEEMAMKIIRELRGRMKNKIGSSEINNVVDDNNHRAFSINFQAYNYFFVILNYDRGRIGFSIKYGEKLFIGLENSQKWYEQVDFDILCKELQEQLELRIPDKFLEANGWK